MQEIRICALTIGETCLTENALSLIMAGVFGCVALIVMYKGR